MAAGQERKATGLPSWREEASTHKATGPAEILLPNERKFTSRRKAGRRPKSKTKPTVKAQLIKHKIIEPVDDQHIMEYGLTEDEIMNHRKHHFHVDNVPLVEVKSNKSNDFREEYSTYCGIKKTIKNWLYYV